MLRPFAISDEYRRDAYSRMDRTYVYPKYNFFVIYSKSYFILDNTYYLYLLKQ